MTVADGGGGVRTTVTIEAKPLLDVQQMTVAAGGGAGPSDGGGQVALRAAPRA